MRALIFLIIINYIYLLTDSGLGELLRPSRAFLAALCFASFLVFPVPSGNRWPLTIALIVNLRLKIKTFDHETVIVVSYNNVTVTDFVSFAQPAQTLILSGLHSVRLYCICIFWLNEWYLHTFCCGSVPHWIPPHTSLCMPSSAGTHSAEKYNSLTETPYCNVKNNYIGRQRHNFTECLPWSALERHVFTGRTLEH